MCTGNRWCSIALIAAIFLLTVPTLFGNGTEEEQEAKTFKVWWYEQETFATSIAWEAALEEFKRTHPNVTVQFERKGFEFQQRSGLMVLASQDVPDLMQTNKGNATAGVYSEAGLLTKLDEVAEERGWTEIMSPSVQSVARYDDRGIMGSGELWGVTTYGEYVMVYYNKDMFDEYGLSEPASYAEYEEILATLKENGIQPLSVGAADQWPVTQNWYELALYKAGRDFINNFQFLTEDIDFEGEEFTYGAQEFQSHIDAGYYGDNVNGIDYGSANSAFVQGEVAMTLTGSWQYSTFMQNVTDFEWGTFLMPGKTLNTGSGGNLFVVPKNATNKELAYDFLDIVFSQEYQTMMAEAGGIPLNANLDAIEDEKVKELNAQFNTIVNNDGLAFYPDWPIPDFMTILGGGLQELIAGEVTPTEFLEDLSKEYYDFKETLP